MAVLESCQTEITQQNGIDLLLNYLHEDPASFRNGVEIAACERVLQKAAIALTRLSREERHAQLIAESAGSRTSSTPLLFLILFVTLNFTEFSFCLCIFFFFWYFSKCIDCVKFVLKMIKFFLSPNKVYIDMTYLSSNIHMMLYLLEI